MNAKITVPVSELLEIINAKQTESLLSVTLDVAEFVDMLGAYETKDWDFTIISGKNADGVPKTIFFSKTKFGSEKDEVELIRATGFSGPSTTRRFKLSETAVKGLVVKLGIAVVTADGLVVPNRGKATLLTNKFLEQVTEVEVFGMSVISK